MTTTPGRAPQTGGSQIESVLHEDRVFAPPPAASLGLQAWLVGSLEEYRRLHRRSLADPEGFWAEQARALHWFRPWDRVLSWNPPDARWFEGGTTNIAYNCLERQIEAGLGEAPAIVWEGEPIGPGGPEVRRLSYREVLRESCRLANALGALGVRRGDVVTIYMGMVPELPIAMLACARLGAPHSVIFGGFSAQAIADRVSDASSRVVITCDGAWRRGKVVPLKQNVDAAVAQLAAGPGGGARVDHVIVLKRCGNAVSMEPGRDAWWHEAVARQSECRDPEPVESEEMLFLLYTSGSTGKPKGIVHTTGGYMVYAATTARYVFNLVPPPGPGGGGPGAPAPTTAAGAQPLYWCTADLGWVTGHSYILYGILPTGVPTFMYEGAPNFPAEDRFWDIIARHRVTHFYTAPTAIRAFMKWGEQFPSRHDLSSLKVLGTVGEPINPEAWMWYSRVIGGGTPTAARCPIVDTWWQTETGGHMITPLPGAIPTKPGSCTLPFFGIDAAVVTEDGREVPANTGGLLVIRRPWPGMIRGVHGDRARFIDTYFSRVRVPGWEPAGSAGGAPGHAEGPASRDPAVRLTGATPLHTTGELRPAPGEGPEAEQVAPSPLATALAAAGGTGIGGHQPAGTGPGGGAPSTGTPGVQRPWGGAPSPYYFTGDGARRDPDGYFWIMGRVDDVINVAGHRLGTMEIESALVSHPAVAEAAVVGMPHDLKGTGIAAFVSLRPVSDAGEGASARGPREIEGLRARLAEHVAAQIGAIARPDWIRFTEALPKTRSGKIMRRLLRDIAAGVTQTTQDTTTLEDFSVLAKLREAQES
ncbi:MAG TPA: acetate--CoA ligase [Phycisphaerales bacterium]|nr:acetate--CoA ligase [Phycisphaerales bacterium]